MVDMFGFDGQADLTESLSDEAFLAEEEKQEQERQEEETPQTETEDIENKEETEEPTPEPEQEQENVEDGGVEEAPEQAEAVGQAEENTDELARWKKNYDELRSWDTKLSQENAELRKKLEALQNAPAPMPVTPQPIEDKSEDSEEDVRKRVRLLVNDPNAFIAPMVAEQLKPLLQEKEEREKAAAEERSRNEFNQAFAECSSCWGQLGTEEGKHDMVQEMVKLSQMRSGTTDAWQKEPARYIFDACRSLWGLPKVNNPEVVEAAKKAERDAVMAEINSRGSKAGLAINNTGNKIQEEKQEPDIDPEIKAMMESKSIGLFD